MAIGITLLTNGGSTTDGQTYNSASITPPGNELILAFFANARFSPPVAAVTAAGNGLTWVEVATVAFSDDTDSLYRLTCFRAMGASPSAGAVTFSVAGTSNNQGIWSIMSLSGVDTSGTNGSGAIVQSVTNRARDASPNNITVTLAALGDAVNNAVVAGFSNDIGDLAGIGTGYSELSDAVLGGGDAIGLQVQYKIPGTTTPNATGFTDFAYLAGIALEIKAGGAAATTRQYRLTTMGVS